MVRSDCGGDLDNGRGGQGTPLRRDARVLPEGREGASLLKSREQHSKEMEQHA